MPRRLEGFDDHPEILKALFKDIHVDIDTLISTTSRTFGLADVIAASITVSSLASYREKASHFFSVFTDRPHDFPWDFAKVFITNDDPESNKEYASKLERLERVFQTRHEFIHETGILDAEPGLFGDDLPDCVDDALGLMSQFDKQYEHILMSPKYADIKDDEGLADAVTRNLEEIESVFERIKSVCDERQYDSLDKFKKAFLDYLWARCDFQVSVFIAERSEWAMSQFLDLAPEYRAILKEIGLRQKFMLAQHPIAEQYADIGLEPDGSWADDSDITDATRVAST
jgi:hypothetical protein